MDSFDQLHIKSFDQLHIKRRDSIEVLFQKKLTPSDTSHIQCKVIIPKEYEHRLRKYFGTRDQIKRAIDLQVYDMDEGSEINEIFRLKYQERCNTYVFQNGWYQFVKRKNLHPGHTVQFFWNNETSRILFQTQERDPAPPGGHGQWMQESPRAFT